MLIDYSSSNSLDMAITDTFSGEKPCGLCNVIASEKERDADRDKNGFPAPPASVKYGKELLPLTIACLLAPLSEDYLPPPFQEGLNRLSSITISPLLPPPRA